MKPLPSALIFCALTLAAFSAHAGPKESFIEGNLAYGKAEYESAIEHFKEALNSNHPLSSNSHAQLHYNLGNAYLRNGQLGASIASYLKSLAQQPLDEDLIANLQFARSQTKDDLVLEEADPILKTLFFWHFSFGRSDALLVFLVANAIFWLTMGLRLYAPINSALVLVQRCALLITLLVGASVFIRWVAPNQIAVIQSKQANVFAGQDAASVIRFKLHEGSEVSAVAVDGNWVKVDLPEQKQGWIKASDVVVVKL